MLSELFKKFSQKYKDDVGLTISKDMESYQILVEKVPDELRGLIDSKNLDIKGSIGQGNTTYYPWVGIFDDRVSTGATNGFYVVFLFSDDFEDLYLTLNQGSTRQTDEEIESYRNFVFSQYSEIDGFTKGRLPEGSLVKERSGSSASKGKAYERTNMFYKNYVIDELEDDSQIIRDLKTILDIYRDCAEKYMMRTTGSDLSAHSFFQDCINADFQVSENLCYRFVSALIAKPFVILTGLSGSGKTKLAQAFCKWLVGDSDQYEILPVGSDWTNREPLLGYPNALEQGKYVKPDNGVLDLLIEANKPENKNKPYFLILDEMNLSHVERYFADFLSAMESDEPIPLHDDRGDWKDEVPHEVSVPKNLFVIGTVNIDETTYMFSPKVLDRAQVIEFYVTQGEMAEFMEKPVKPNLEKLNGRGAGSTNSFVELSRKQYEMPSDMESEIQDVMEMFFENLKESGAEFGYRTAHEIFRFCGVLHELTEDESWTYDHLIDAAIVQKLLPRLHGSRKKLEPVLDQVAKLCVDIDEGPEELIEELVNHSERIPGHESVRFPVSLEKVLRMKKRVMQDGFTSFAEA